MKMGTNWPGGSVREAVAQKQFVAICYLIRSTYYKWIDIRSVNEIIFEQCVGG